MGAAFLPWFFGSLSPLSDLVGSLPSPQRENRSTCRAHTSWSQGASPEPWGWEEGAGPEAWNPVPILGIVTLMGHRIRDFLGVLGFSPLSLEDSKTQGVMGLPRADSEAVPMRGPDAGLLILPALCALCDLGASVVWVGGSGWPWRSSCSGLGRSSEGCGRASGEM